MQVDQIHSLLDSFANAEPWLTSLGITQPRTAHANLLRLAKAGMPLDLLGTICEQFQQSAPQLADPDMALNNLERFLLSSRNILSAAALFERDRQSLPNLLLMFNSSQHLSDQLCSDAESYDLLRMTEGQPVAREPLVEELVESLRGLNNEADVLASLRRFKRREHLRIAYGDIVQELPVETITRQLSYVADALVEGALEFAKQSVAERFTKTNGSPFSPPRFAVLALGKLGGLELNYSSDVDLVFLFQPTNSAHSRRETASQDYANRVAQHLIQLLSDNTDLGFAYRVDMRLRPEGKQGPICSEVDKALSYYDLRGRTWERQAYVKARPIAGDLDLGNDFLNQLEPWIYRRYLTLADIAGIKLLKRNLEANASESVELGTNVKLGRGGIRDIEFVIQFLQLVSGGVEPGVRTGNTLDAISCLEQFGGLTHQERMLLEENYRFLRKLEHRLQIMYDLQTHTLPISQQGLIKVSRRMGYVDSPESSAIAAFQSDYEQRTEVNHKILTHLLHDAFGEDAETEPEVDLVNNPNPDDETIANVLGQYPFQDIPAAYSNLMSLAAERIPFLSTRRCRLFLAAIAPRLLSAIAQTPDPDATLVTLSRVSDSIGGKAALWELFSSNHPTLNLYVTLCAACPYLSGILTSNPGMIDELLDSLLIDHLPSIDTLEQSLSELIRGAEDVGPILHSFKHAQHLRVGVRDILGKDDIEATHAELSDIAEVCLKQIIATETSRLLDKLGEPHVGEPPKETAEATDELRFHPGHDQVGRPCEFVVLAMGKLGGREPNYHSDLDLIFLYEADGMTVVNGRGHASATTNQHFYSELGQRIIKQAGSFGPYGRLYEVDTRLRPTGKSGSLAVSLDEFVRYFTRGNGQLWERQSLCKARVITGSAAVKQRTKAAVQAAMFCQPWQPKFAAEIREMRLKLQETASPRNLKRAAGGTMDTEFIVQMLQLMHGQRVPSILKTGTLDGLAALRQEEILTSADADFLGEAYRFQRSIEARIRLMDAAGRHEFPDDQLERSKLAFLLGYSDTDKLAREVSEVFCEVRGVFLRVFSAAEQE